MASEVMEDIAGVIGIDLALILAARREGRTLHIPESEQNDKFLHLIIGREAAAKLIFELGGMDVELPALKMLDMHRRNEHICRLAAHGMPLHDIAHVANVSTRHARRILREEQGLVDAYRQTAEGRKAGSA